MNWIRIAVLPFTSLALLCALTPVPAAAQDTEPGWLNVRVIEVKPDRAGEWIELQKEMNAAIKKAGGTGRDIFQVARGDVDTYHIVTLVPKLGANDEPAANPLGEVRFAQWGARVSQCVGRRQVLTLRRIPELSIPAKEGQRPNLVMLTMRTTIAGKDAEYSKYLKDDIVPALKKAKLDAFYVSRVFAGESPYTWIGAGWVDKWSSFDEPHPIIRALGEAEGTKVLQKGGAIIARAQNVLLRYRADLSVHP